MRYFRIHLELSKRRNKDLELGGGEPQPTGSLYYE
jgi:hypothetical protein